MWFILFIQLLFEQETTWDLNLFTEGGQLKKTHKIETDFSSNKVIAFLCYMDV